MHLTVEDIVRLASCSMPEVDEDFIFNGDTFVMLAHKVTDSTHMYFMEYGQCSSYCMESGIIMKYMSLSNFPPIPKTLSLSAEEIVTGKHLSVDGKYEIRIKKLNEMFKIKGCVHKEELPTNAVPFRRKYCEAV